MFADARAGAVRVLFGSSMLMGAGMNVQDRLTALHHLDVAWRADYMEQRDARILRPGNRLLDEIEGFSVRIYRYATEKSLDTLMFSRLAMKAGMISQFRKGNISQRFIDDTADASVLTYSQMKAATSGNQELIREVELETELAALDGERAERLRKKGEAAGKLKDTENAPARKETLESERESFAAAVLAGVPGMFRLPDGRSAPRKDMDALDGWLNGFAARAREPGSPDWIPVGAWRGLGVDARKSPGASAIVEFGLRRGERRYMHPVSLNYDFTNGGGVSPSGFVKRLDNVIDRHAPVSFEDRMTRITESVDRRPALEAMLAEPFAGEARMSEIRSNSPSSGRGSWPPGKTGTVPLPGTAGPESRASRLTRTCGWWDPTMAGAAAGCGSS
jgi:hypothetical protein